MGIQPAGSHIHYFLLQAMSTTPTSKFLITWKMLSEDSSLCSENRNIYIDCRERHKCPIFKTLPWNINFYNTLVYYRGADKSLTRPGKKQARKHVTYANDFNNIETRAVIKLFFFLPGKTQREIHAILKETLACFLSGRSKDLSATLYIVKLV